MHCVGVNVHQKTVNAYERKLKNVNSLIPTGNQAVSLIFTEVFVIYLPGLKAEIVSVSLYMVYSI